MSFRAEMRLQSAKVMLNSESRVRHSETKRKDIMIAKLMGLNTGSPKQSLQEIEKGEMHIYDLNSPMSYNQAHVPGVIHVNHATFDGSKLPADKHARLVFFCSNPMCRKVPNAAKLANKLGYTNTAVLIAGIAGWVNKKMLVESVA